MSEEIKKRLDDMQERIREQAIEILNLTQRLSKTQNSLASRDLSGFWLRVRETSDFFTALEKVDRRFVEIEQAASDDRELLYAIGGIDEVTEKEE